MAAAAVIREGRALRRLGLQETMWHEMVTRHSGTSLLQYALHLQSDQPLSETTVRTALGDLQRQLPLLRARVALVDGARHLVAGPCPDVPLDVPLSVLPPGGDWLTEYHRQLREQTVDTETGPLWKATLMPGAGRSQDGAHGAHGAVLLLSLCHTITDGVSNGLICRRLVRGLALAAAGRTTDLSAVPTAAVSPPVDQLVRDVRLPLTPAFGRELFRVLSLALRRRRHPFLERFVAPYDPDIEYWNQTIPAALTAEETSALRSQCHRRGVSVNSVLSAAVSLSAGRLLGGDCPPLPTMWLVSAHRYLPPPAEGRQLSAASGALGEVRLGDLWPVAEQIGVMLDRQVTLKLPVLPLKLLDRFMTPERIVRGLQKNTKPAAHSAFVYNINNIGILDDTPTSGGGGGGGSGGNPPAVRLVEVHRAFRAHPAMDACFGSHCFHTVSGRLCYDLNFLHGRVREEHARQLAEGTLQIIRQAAAQG